MTEPRRVYYIPEDDAYDEKRGFRAAVVTEGHPGYQFTGTWPNDGTQVMPYFWGHERERAEATAVRQNTAMGISQEDAERIVLSAIGAQIRTTRRAEK